MPTNSPSERKRSCCGCCPRMDPKTKEKCTSTTLGVFGVVPFIVAIILLILKFTIPTSYGKKPTDTEYIDD